MKIDAGDIGTKGGLLTDVQARVLREDRTPIAGLYAIGNTAASMMGRTYPGAGSTIGPAMVFGFRAAEHIHASGETNAGANSFAKQAEGLPCTIPGGNCAALGE
ncbi:FAD binding domain protein [compost metagenome]